MEYTGPLNPNVADGGEATLNPDGTSSYGFAVSDLASWTQTLDNQIDTSSGNPWSVQLYTRTTDPDGHWSDSYQWNVAAGGVGTLSFTVYEDGSYTESITSVGDGTIPLSALPSGVSIPSTLVIPAGGSETVSIAQRKSGDPAEVTFDVYDAAGNLVDVYTPPVADAKNNGTLIAPHTHYDYDASGDEIQQIDADGDVTHFAYDENGNEVSRTLPDGEKETFTYNAYGQEATHTDFDGNVASYSYYSSFGGGAYTGSLKQVVYTPGAGASAGTMSQTVTYTYDAQGRQLTVTDASGTTTDSYDAQGNLIEQQTPEGIIHYVFDPATGNHTETYTTDTDTLYEYNPQGELTTVSVTVNKLNGTALATPLVTSYTYDAAGNLHTETLPDGEVTTYGYDDENRLTSQTEVLNGTTLFSESFILNDDGTRASANETQKQADGTTITTNTTWGYDADQRLISEAYTSNAPTSENYSNAFTYDLAGNRITETHAGPGDGPTESITYTYNGDDQLTQQVSSLSGTTLFTYDLNGSQLTSSNNGTTTTYVYDVRNKMATVQTNGTTTATYVYDDAGDRVQETTGGMASLYLTDEQNPTGYAQPLEVRQGSTAAAALTSAPTTTYLLGNHVFGQVNGASAVNYLLTDGHGSTQQMTSSTGVVTAAFRYDAYGTALNFTATSAPTVFIFGGDAVYDPVSGLYLHGDGVRGVDGFKFIEADIQNNGSNSDPIALHKYSYAGNNPLDHDDPSGFDILDDLEILGGTAAPVVGIPYLLLHHTYESNFTPNWGSGVGPVEHGFASVTLKFPGGSAQQIASQIYNDLLQFNYFDNPIAYASVSGNRVSFSTKGALGYLQGRIDPVNPTVQLVPGPGQDELSAVTLGSHMLSGVRRWRVVVVSQSPVVLQVETEAYEQSAGDLNALGREFGPGQQAQYDVWDDYLNNIAAHWSAAAGATSSGATHITETPISGPNPWRSALPPALQ